MADDGAGDRRDGRADATGRREAGSDGDAPDRGDDGNGGSPDGEEQADGDDERAGEPEDVSVSRTEAAVMAVALGVTVALFAFAGWQALAGATTVPPTANVTASQGAAGNGSYYTVTLRNEGDVGLVSVTVGVDCPTPSRTVTFENVPAQTRRNATVRCPPEGSPSAEVTSWIPE